MTKEVYKTEWSLWSNSFTGLELIVNDIRTKKNSRNHWGINRKQRENKAHWQYSGSF